MGGYLGKTVQFWFSYINITSMQNILSTFVQLSDLELCFEFIEQSLQMLF